MIKFKLPDFPNLSITRVQLIGLIITALLLISIPFGIFLSQKTQIFKPKAAYTPSPIQYITKEALQARDNYNLAVSSGGQHAASIQYKILQSKLETRKKDLLNLAYENPEEFLRNATLADEASTFPEGVRADIEKRVTFSGNISKNHIDDLETKQAEYNYYIQSQDNSTIYDVRFTSKPAKIKNGSEITINGINLETFLVTDPSSVSELNIANSNIELELPTPDYPQFSRGKQNAIAYLFNFQDDPSQPISKNDLKLQLQKKAFSVTDYFNKASRGNIEFNFDVQDWHTLDIPSNLDSDINCSYLNPGEVKNLINKVRYSWDSKGINRHLDLLRSGQFNNNYQHLVFFYPRKSLCGRNFGAFAYNQPKIYFIDEATQVSTPISMLAIIPIYADSIYRQGVIIHELGHSVGLNHANMFDDCPPQTNYTKIYFVDKFGRCSIEYLDDFDNMGSTYKNQILFNAPHKYALGWLKPSEYQIINPGINLTTIYGLDSLDDEFKTLLIPRKSTGGYLFVEYRNWQSAFFSTFNPPSFTLSGVFIKESGGQLNTYSSGIYLTNDEPAGLTKRPQFLTGDVFSDPANGITIEVFEINPQANYATVKVSYFPNASFNPSLTPSRSITNVYLELPTGGNPDIATYKDRPYGPFSLTKDKICNGNQFEDIRFRVKYSDSNQEVPLLVRFKLSDGVKQNICNTSSSPGTADTLVPPVNLKSECISNNTRARLSWGGVGADGYDLRIDVDPETDKWTGCSSPKGDSCINSTPLTDYTLNVTSGTKYRWWVHSVAKNYATRDKRESSPSETKEFTCEGGSDFTVVSVNIPARNSATKECKLFPSDQGLPDGWVIDETCPTSDVPVNLSVSCNNGKTTLSWDRITDRVVDVRVNYTDDSWDGSCASAAGDFCSNSYSGNSITFDAKVGQFGWWVHGLDSSGKESEAATDSKLYSCNLPAPTSLKSSCNGNGTVTLSWDNVSGAGNYQLRVDKFTNTPFDSWYKPEQGDQLPTSDTNSKTISITPNEKYYWVVQSLPDGYTSQTYGPTLSREDGGEFSCPN